MWLVVVQSSFRTSVIDGWVTEGHSLVPKNDGVVDSVVVVVVVVVVEWPNTFDKRNVRKLM